MTSQSLTLSLWLKWAKKDCNCNLKSTFLLQALLKEKQSRIHCYVFFLCQKWNLTVSIHIKPRLAIKEEHIIFLNTFIQQKNISKLKLKVYLNLKDSLEITYYKYLVIQTQLLSNIWNMFMFLIIHRGLKLLFVHCTYSHVFKKKWKKNQSNKQLVNVQKLQDKYRNQK